MRSQIFIIRKVYTKDVTDPYTPHGVLLGSSQETRDENLGESYLHPPAADAIINNGPREAGANPIQISGGDGWTPQPCS